MKEREEKQKVIHFNEQIKQKQEEAKTKRE